jgi:hypothetical protein
MQAGIVERVEAAVARRRRGKHVSSATNQRVEAVNARQRHGEHVPAATY